LHDKVWVGGTHLYNCPFGNGFKMLSFIYKTNDTLVLVKIKMTIYNAFH